MRRVPGTSPAAFIAALAILALSSAGCSNVANALAGPTSASAKYTTGGLEQETYSKVNSYRTSQGLCALAWNDALASQARQHSADMANGVSGFGHDGFSARVDAIVQVVAISGAAENLAMTSGLSDPAGAVVSGWLSSPTHKPQIEGNFDLTGVGVAFASNGSIYFTQMYAKSR